MSIKYLSTLSTAAVLTFAAASAPASIVWNWSADGGNDKGTFTTAGSNTAPLAAANYTITDAAITTSNVLPLGSISNGTYVFSNHYSVAAPFFISWNGLAVTNIDDTSSSGVNGLIIALASNSENYGIFGADNFGSDGAGRFGFFNVTGGFSRGTDLLTTPVLAPEPTTISLLSLAGAGMLGRRRRSRI